MTTTIAPVPLRALRALTPQQIADAIDLPVERWRHQCHVVSDAIVRSDLFPPGTCRVARGTCSGVGGQHSWVVFGDPYNDHSLVLDCTLWSYTDADTVHVQRGYAGDRRRGRHTYRPKGWGSHWATGIPRTDGQPDATPAALDGEPLIALFRDHVGGPLSVRWWMQFLDGPVGGWPYREWLPVLAADRVLAPHTPIDVLGMGTELHPEGYLHPQDPRIPQEES